jgi:hypothetical protein
MGFFDDRIPLFNNEGDKMETVEVDALTAILTELDEVRKNREYWLAENGRIGSQLIDLVNYSYENELDSEDILKSICEIIDYEAKREVSFTATIRIEGRVDIPYGEDVSDYLNNVEFNVDTYNGDVVIDNTYPEDVEEN